jgi:hypothetical protein
MKISRPCLVIASGVVVVVAAIAAGAVAAHRSHGQNVQEQADRSVELLNDGRPSSKTAAKASTSARLIHYGWDNTRIWSLNGVLPKLNNSVFDGMSISASQFTEIFMATAHPSSIIDDDKAYIDQIPRAQLALLKNSYMLVHSKTDDVFDWSNDTHWTSTMSNMRLLVKLAQYAELKGLVYDMEPYGKSPWDYATQPAAVENRLSFAKLSALVRRRGRRMMDMMQTEFPGLEIWCLYGLSALTGDYYAGSDFDAQQALQDAGYGLWAPFYNGWIDTMAASTTIVDGNEPSYYFTRTNNFTDQKRLVRYSLDVFLANDTRTKYHNNVKMGHAVYVDAVMNTHNSPRFIGYYLNDTKYASRTKLLHSNALNALQSTESVVWVYSEIFKWWRGKPVVPKRVDQALKKAKADYKSGNVLPPKPWNALRQAEWGIRNAKFIGGTFQSADGTEMFAPSTWGSNLNNNACTTWGDRGQYHCTYPLGSTVTITPKIEGRIVKPRSRTFVNVTVDNWSVNWVVE